jgi:predicted transcriptional regulator YdeE
MKATPISLEADLVIVGLPLRTSPARATEDIPKHWQEFMGADIASQVSKKKDDGHVYAVYCDYEADWRGAYTMVLGVAVEPSSPVPPGLRRVRVPAGDYASFRANGSPTDVIWRTWMYINEEWSERGRRRYIADVERYKPGTAPDAVEADVIVGLT